MEKKYSDYELEQQLHKFKANRNSNYIKSRGKLDYLEDYEITSLDEYILKLKRGELVVDAENSDLENFEKTKTVLPKIGEVMVFENSNVSTNRKLEALKTVEQADFSNNKDLINYSVIPIREGNNRVEVVIDENGFDLGIITYDEKGKPSFEISQNLKDAINEMLNQTKARSQVDEKTIEDEFYLKDIESFIRAAQEGKLVPKSIEEVGKRAASAMNIKNKNYTQEDAENSIIQTEEEKDEERELADSAKRKLAKSSRVTPKENERSITEEKREDEEIEVENSREVIRTEPKLIKTEPDDKTKEEEKENDKIPENKLKEVNAACQNQNLSQERITAVFIIKDPSTLADCTENSHINRNGNEVTVIQFSNITGKDRYIMIQDGIELGGEAHDEAFRDLIAPLKTTQGVYKRVEDNENYVDYTNSSGTGEKMQIRGVPNDISKTQKEYFRERFEILMDELEKARKNEPENTVKIDEIEEDIYKLCIYFNIIANPSIKEAAEEVQEPEKKKDEDDGRDPRETLSGDPRGPRN